MMKKRKFPFCSWLASSKPALISTIALHLILVLLVVSIINILTEKWIVNSVIIFTVIILMWFWQRTVRNYFND